MEINFYPFQGEGGTVYKNIRLGNPGRFIQTYLYLDSWNGAAIIRATMPGSLART